MRAAFPKSLTSYYDSVFRGRRGITEFCFVAERQPACPYSALRRIQGCTSLEILRLKQPGYETELASDPGATRGYNELDDGPDGMSRCLSDAVASPTKTFDGCLENDPAQNNSLDDDNNLTDKVPSPLPVGMGLLSMPSTHVQSSRAHVDNLNETEGWPNQPLSVRGGGRRPPVSMSRLWMAITAGEGSTWSTWSTQHVYATCIWCTWQDSEISRSLLVSYKKRPDEYEEMSVLTASTLALDQGVEKSVVSYNHRKFTAVGELENASSAVNEQPPPLHRRCIDDRALWLYLALPNDVRSFCGHGREDAEVAPRWNGPGFE
ncbi:hypothetical protein FB451DRAFT_1186277 [Mycena latifolia]|nr:hypothetical protein FB451DRAFT_1186277 [Mycena latifolia]